MYKILIVMCGLSMTMLHSADKTNLNHVDNWYEIFSNRKFSESMLKMHGDAESKLYFANKDKGKEKLIEDVFKDTPFYEENLVSKSYEELKVLAQTVLQHAKNDTLYQDFPRPSVCARTENSVIDAIKTADVLYDQENKHKKFALLGYVAAADRYCDIDSAEFCECLRGAKNIDASFNYDVFKNKYQTTNNTQNEKKLKQLDINRLYSLSKLNRSQLKEMVNLMGQLESYEPTGLHAAFLLSQTSKKRQYYAQILTNFGCMPEEITQREKIMRQITHDLMLFSSNKFSENIKLKTSVNEQRNPVMLTRENKPKSFLNLFDGVKRKFSGAEKPIDLPEVNSDITDLNTNKVDSITNYEDMFQRQDSFIAETTKQAFSLYKSMGNVKTPTPQTPRRTASNYTGKNRNSN